jgi:acyl-CoA thioester hydrolase
MTVAPNQDIGVEIWRGGVNTWDCDEMGHMNVRFYVTRSVEALAGMAAEMGMPFAYAPYANSTLLIREQHIRFLREAHAGAALHMTGGIVSIDETEAWVLQILYHSDTGQPAATIQSRIAHVTARDGTAFGWPSIVRERAKALMVAVPGFAAARSVDLIPVVSEASLERANALNLTQIGLGALLPQDCDIFGRMRPEQFIGRISDGIGRLIIPFRDQVASLAEVAHGKIGGAVLEYRLVQLDWPRAGERIAIRSGLRDVDERTMRVVHWMIDPDTGKAWGSSEGIAITFDLDARKIVPISPAAQAALQSQRIVGLGL